MKRFIFALVLCGLFLSADASTIVADPSAAPIASNVTDFYSGVRLTSQDGLSGTGLVGQPVFTRAIDDPALSGIFFSYGNEANNFVWGDTWSTFPTLLIDLTAPADYLSVDFIGWSESTAEQAILRIFSPSGTFLEQITGEVGLRGSVLELSYQTFPAEQIGYATATYGAEDPDSSFGLIGEIRAGTGTSAVPVPASVWLFGSALGLLGWYRRTSG